MAKRVTEVKETDHILDAVIEQLLRKGIKATTMDSVANSLKMSKRTLYELFGSKDNLVELSLVRFNRKLADNHKKAFDKSDNVMEAMVDCLASTKEWMSIAHANFFRDIEEFKIKKSDEKIDREARYKDLEKFFIKGAEEGYFRKDLNFQLQCKMLSIQMESLKRMEELFPPEISLLEAYQAISYGFLRSVSTRKGIDFLENKKEKIIV